MIYLSKGMVVKPSTEQILIVTRGGKDHQLTGDIAKLWLDGRHVPAKTDDVRHLNHVKHLVRIGLSECSDTGSDTDLYRMLTRCILVRAQVRALRRGLNSDEKFVWTWLQGAGLNLTMAELVFLMGNRVQPERIFMGKENAQILTGMLYTSDNFHDNLLEQEMERNPSRDLAVKTVLGLLRKKRLILT